MASLPSEFIISSLRETNGKLLSFLPLQKMVLKQKNTFSQFGRYLCATTTILDNLINKGGKNGLKAKKVWCSPYHELSLGAKTLFVFLSRRGNSARQRNGKWLEYDPITLFSSPCIEYPLRGNLSWSERGWSPKWGLSFGIHSQLVPFLPVKRSRSRDIISSIPG